MERRLVKLRLVDRPERMVSLDDLRTSYKLGGFRAKQAELARISNEPDEGED